MRKAYDLRVKTTAKERDEAFVYLLVDGLERVDCWLEGVNLLEHSLCGADLLLKLIV